ncbi:MAG TPA: hypothetical protein VFW87_13765 [Pirellulales bacterium]|nr:hypothetical protein [Pirellulales bacterium]
MRDRRLRHNSILPIRRAFALAAVLAYVAAAVGVPLPVGGGKDRSVAFPCMDRPCGCRDARGCKEHCCCFTSVQKLAWVDEHQVDPTPFVNFAALAPRRPAGTLKSSEHGAACCVTGSRHLQVPARHDGRKASAAPLICLDDGLAPSDTADRSADRSAGRSAEPTADPPEDDTISIAAYRTCHGLAPLWSTLGAALPPPPPMAYEFLWDAGESIAAIPTATVAVALSPPTPPPRG